MVNFALARPPRVNPPLLMSASRPAPGASLSPPLGFLFMGANRVGAPGPVGDLDGSGGEDIVVPWRRNRKNGEYFMYLNIFNLFMITIS